MKKVHLGFAITAVLVTRGQAIPSLQLDASPSKYVGGSEDSIQATANPFQVYALADSKDSDVSLSSTYFISLAIVKHCGDPMTVADKNFGTFTISGIGVAGGTKTYSLSDLVFGNPPLESDLNKDDHDLSRHSIFPTYFAEVSFLFDFGKTARSYNSKDDPDGLVPDPNGSLYFQNWTVDITGLAEGYDLHFDLYNEKVKSSGDIDVDDFAPFSHDLVSGPKSNVPDTSSSLILLSLALLGLAGVRYGFPKGSIFRTS